MKLKNGAIGIGFVLVIIATVLLLLLPASVNLYIAYVCCLIGIGMMVVSAVFFDKKDVPGSFAQLMQAAWYLPVSLAVSIVVLIVQEFVEVPALVHIVAQFLLCAIAAIKLIGVNAGKDYIRNQDAVVLERTARIADLITEVDAASAKISVFPAEQQQRIHTAVRSLKEAIRYSDPMSNISVADLDRRIAEKVYMLQTKCSPDGAEAFIADCEELCADIKYRNNVLKSSKS